MDGNPDATRGAEEGLVNIVPDEVSASDPPPGFASIPSPIRASSSSFEEEAERSGSSAAAAFSFTRYEVFAGVEHSTPLGHNTSHSAHDGARGLHAVALDVMNGQNLISNPAQSLNDRFTESVEGCKGHVEALLGSEPSPADISRLITTMIGANPTPDTPMGVLGGAASRARCRGTGGCSQKRLSNWFSPTLDWSKVIDGFDQNQYFNVRNQHALQLLTDILLTAFKDATFPIEKLYNVWPTNRAGHLSWLTQITNHPTIFNIFDYPHKLVNLQCLKIQPDEADRSLMTWRCLDLIEVLFRLGENTTFSRIVYTLLQNPGPIHKCPDILALVMVQLTSPLTVFRQYVFRQVINQLINGHANSVPVLNYVWNVDENAGILHTVITTAFSDYYNIEDPTRLTRILELAHELKPNGLGELFNLQQYTFAIDLACLAARRDFLKLDKFLDDKLNDVGEPFAQHLCHFIKKRMTPGNPNQLSPDIIQTICAALQCRTNSMPWLVNDLGPLDAPNADADANISALRANQGASTPMDYRPPGRDSGPNIVPNEIAALSNAFAADDDLSSAVFSESTQEKANWYFQRIYNFGNPLPELLSCLLKNLFDEFKFFAEYPERELRTTAKVYGGIIREGIVVNMKFATAIRRIVEALQSPHGSLLNMFGMVAINECRACLHKYTKICQMVSTLECYNWLNDELREYITCGGMENLRNTPQPGQPSTPLRFPMRQLTGPSMITVANVDILVSATEQGGHDIAPPDESVVDKIGFMFNNLSLSTCQEKAAEMKEIIRSQDKNFIPWLAQYLVIRRITTEQNHQGVYNSFLMAIADEALNEHILRETYRNIQTLLNSDKRHAASNFSDRQLLKSLGLWLGSITIARDEPILYKDLNLKGLLLDAFYRGQQDLLYVVPFIAKVLLATSKSVIFNPRCTWIYNIMKVLAEIHNEPDLQLNLKFEIEVVCKELQLELREIEVTGVLKDSSRLSAYRQQMDMGEQQRMSGMMQSMQQMAPATTPTSGLTQQQQQHVSRQQHMMQQQQAALSAMSAHQKQQHTQIPGFAPSIMNTYASMDSAMPSDPSQQSELLAFVASVEAGQTNLNAFPQIKFLVQQAIMAAVTNELLAGIINKAASVTVTATRCLCRKDFAMSPDENQLRRAAQQMMRSMNLGMATVSSREQLMTSLQSNLRQAFQNHYCNGQSELPKILEHAVVLLAEANIDPATNHLAKNGCEKAVQEVETQMSKDFESRAECRTEGRPFKPDPSLITLNSKLPEMLRMSMDPMRRAAQFGAERTPSTTNFDLQARIQNSQQRIQNDNAYQFADNNAAAYMQTAMDTNRSPDNLQHKAESTFREWINMCQRTNREQENYMMIINVMREAGLLNDKIISDFFKHCTKICFDVVYRLNESPQQVNSRARCYIPLDAFGKLSTVMKILSILVNALIADHNTRREDFNGMPFMRIFITMFTDLAIEDPHLDPLGADILQVFWNALQEFTPPRRLPGFVFHWLEIVGNRHVLARFFNGHTDLTQSRRWYIQLLLEHLRFLGPFLRCVNIPANIQTIYKGTIRIMLVILNDFPDVFCEYHYVLCDVIPPHCLQLRNFVLSASPREMRLPDAMTPKVTEKPELVNMMHENPVMHNELSALLDSEVMRSVLSADVRTRLDAYLRHRSDVAFLSELRNILMVNPSPGCQYNISIVNAIVMHVGAFAIDSIKEKMLRICINTVANTSCMDIFQNLVITLDTQGRYLLFNAIANQLRYPNSHTTYFSNTLLYLFLQAHTTEVQEQITRILLERLLIKWPRPWGVLMTFTELIKKDEYQFWKCEFVRCAPEIKRILARIDGV
ncbi:CCR4-Not complex component, variant [Aphelenchoides fujianensis]|nr:CCR4-Not complex component, variant [Aphelenchoides fujianensis]